MKANEAPEKLYFDGNDKGILDIYSNKESNDDIEYTRTDALIDKALGYIEDNIYNLYDGDNEYGICGGYIKKEEFIKNFKNYMKGE